MALPEPTQQVSPWTLTSWMLSFILNAAGQSTGKTMGLSQGASTGKIIILHSNHIVDLRRCLPVTYALDAMTTIFTWLTLVFAHAKGIREGATMILEDRLANIDDNRDAQALEVITAEIKNIKNGSTMRIIGFLIGVLPTLIKLSACNGIPVLQVLGYLWVGPWIIFEILVLASTTSQATRPGQSLRLELPYSKRIQEYSNVMALAINIVVTTIPSVAFAMNSWHTLTSGASYQSRLDKPALIAALMVLFIFSLWSLIVLFPVEWRDSILLGASGRLRKIFDVGGATILAAIWIPLVIDFRMSPSKTFENECTIWLVGSLFVLLLLSFLRQTLWKTCMYPIMTGFGTILSLLFYIFVNHGHNDTNTHQPQWTDILG